MEWVDDEAVVLDPDSQELHYLNPTAALFFALVQEHGYEEARRSFESRFQIPNVGEELDTLIAQMRDGGLLVDD